MHFSLLKAGKERAKQALRTIVGSYGQPDRDLEPSLWGLSLRASEGLALEGVSLHRLRDTFGSPLHVVHAARLRANIGAFQAVPDGSKTAAEVFYSYKTNPVPGVLSILHEHGVGAEIISDYELWLAQKLGVPPEKIVFNGPAKSDNAIRQAALLGIQTLNFNHREEIPRAARIARDVGKKLRVGLRVNLSEGWSGQFGIPVAGGEALAAFSEALSLDSLEVVGLHVHRGGMIRGGTELLRYVDAVLDFVSVLHQDIGLELEILNFGGSLGTPTVRQLSEAEQRLNQALYRGLGVQDPTEALGIERYLSVLVKRVEAHFRGTGRRQPRIFLEPGRGMTGNAQLLLSTVVSTKATPSVTFAILDAGINHAESVRSEYHQLFPVNRFDEPRDRIYTIVGPICSPGDTLYRSVRLPELRPGDSVAIMDSGAYFVPFSTSFSFPRPGIVLLDGGRVSQLRRIEQFSDLVSCDGIAG